MFKYVVATDQNKTSVVLFIPASWLIFVLLSPVLVGIYENEIGNQLPVGPFILALTVIMPLAAAHLLKIYGALNWKTTLLLLAQTVVSLAGILLIFMYLTDLLRDFIQEFDGV